MLKYLEDMDFEPSKPFPRSEACEVLYRTPQIQRRIEQFWESGMVSAQQPKTPIAPEIKEITKEATPETTTIITTLETELATDEAQPEKTFIPEAQPEKPATSEAQ